MALILIVEDDVQLQQVAKRALELHGHEVIAAGSAGEAKKLSESHPAAPDLLLTDLVLPGLSGRESANFLLTHYPGMAVVYMSGFTNQDSSELARAGRFLRKPFTVPALVAAVEAALAGGGKEGPA